MPGDKKTPAEHICGCHGFSWVHVEEFGGLFQRTLFQAIATDFDRLLGIIAGFDFYNVLTVDVANFFMPHAEFMFAHRKTFNRELSIFVGHGSVRVVNGEPVGSHPGMKIAGHFERQSFCGFNFHLLPLALSCVGRDQHVGSGVLKGVGVGIMSDGVIGDDLDRLAGASNQRVGNEHAVLLVEHDGLFGRRLQIRVDGFGCLGKVDKDVGKALVVGIDNEIVLVGVVSRGRLPYL